MGSTIRIEYIIIATIGSIYGVTKLIFVLCKITCAKNAKETPILPNTSNFHTYNSERIVSDSYLLL